MSGLGAGRLPVNSTMGGVEAAACRQSIQHSPCKCPAERAPRLVEVDEVRDDRPSGRGVWSMEPSDGDRVQAA
jgi:hypothetical protein